MARLKSRRAARQRRHGRLEKLVLTVGFLAVAVGVFAAWLSPATGYELDLYGQTPLVFWLCLLVAVLVSIGLAISSGLETVRWPALFLGGLSALSIMSLPVVRGYLYYGLADSLTHFGWATQIATGAQSPFEFIYPGTHLTAVVFRVTTGKGLAWSMMVLVLLVIVLYYLFVPLAVRSMVDSPAAVVVATYSAFLLLPVNNVATHRMFHPYTMATLLVPLVLFLVFKHVTRAADDDTLPATMSAASLVLPVVGAALLFYHPQTTLDVIIVLATAVGVQVLFRYLWPSSRLAANRLVHGQMLFLGMLFVIWIFQFWQTWSMAAGLLDSLMEVVSGSAQYGKNVQGAQDSGKTLGISLAEIFLKIFLVSAAYAVLAVSLFVAKLLRWVEAQPERDVAIAYFAASGVTLTPFFLLHFVGDISGYFFRHVGFGMVLVTVLGAAALALLVDWADDVGKLRYLVRPTVAIVLVVAVVLSGMAIYPSPWTYKRGHSVSEPTMQGYENAFDYAQNSDFDTRWASFSSETSRFDDAIYPSNDKGVRISGGLSNKSVNNLVGHYATGEGQKSGDHKVPVSRTTLEAETDLYRGLRFTESDFESIERQEGVHRIQSNEELTIYYVETRFNSSSV